MLAWSVCSKLEKPQNEYQALPKCLKVSNTYSQATCTTVHTTDCSFGWPPIGSKTWFRSDALPIHDQTACCAHHPQLTGPRWQN